MNIYWHTSNVTKAERQTLKNHKSVVLWFTGLSGAGKSTITSALEKELTMRNIHTYRLDGDNLRHGLNRNLGFSEADRDENIRRVGEVAKLMVDAGLVVLAALISPYRYHREHVRSLVEPDEFIEVYVKADLCVCEERDPKGLYKKARNGEIRDFTGIDAPYEEPEHPEIVVDTTRQSVEESVQQIVQYLEDAGLMQLKNNFV